MSQHNQSKCCFCIRLAIYFSVNTMLRLSLFHPAFPELPTCAPLVADSGKGGFCLYFIEWQILLLYRRIITLFTFIYVIDVDAFSYRR